MRVFLRGSPRQLLPQFQYPRRGRCLHRQHPVQLRGIFPLLRAVCPKPSPRTLKLLEFSNHLGRARRAVLFNRSFRGELRHALPVPRQFRNPSRAVGAQPDLRMQHRLIPREKPDPARRAPALPPPPRERVEPLHAGKFYWECACITIGLRRISRVNERPPQFLANC